MTDRHKNNHTEEMEQKNSLPGDGQQSGEVEQQAEGVEQEAAAADEQAQDQSNAPGAVPAPSIAELEQRIAEIELQAEEYKENWMRAAADFRNLKRRSEQERSELIKSANAALILKLLPILDDLERAMEHVPEEVAQSSWFEGVRLVQRKFQMILEGEGVQPIEALDKEFDPTLHEAVMYEEVAPEQSGKVIAELRKGYKLGDRVLRPAMVKVGR
ncbi:MAG: protein GrpE [Herpetosiphonaceae bacterium]|nr:MAG: protein GrpE [Herpetosiphonaceae bacterium]